MTKKDYILFADFLGTELAKWNETSPQARVLNDLTNNFADLLKTNNPKFDKPRFLDFISNKIAKTK